MKNKQPLEVLHKKDVLKNDANYQESTCAEISFQTVAGLWPTTSLKRKSITSIFLPILQKIQEHCLYRIPRKDCSFDVTN